MDIKKHKGLNIGLWIAQVLLALTLLWGAYAKLFTPIEDLAQMMPWVKGNNSLVLLTGIVDLLGGLGLILPAALRFKPQLTTYAAYGVALLMVLATVFHISRGEAAVIGFNIFVLILALFVAWGRSKKAIITAK